MPSTYHIPLKSLRPIHFKIIKLYIKCWKKKDIACELGVSSSTVSHTLRDPIAKKIINAIMSDCLHKNMIQSSLKKELNFLASMADTDRDISEENFTKVGVKF